MTKDERAAPPSQRRDRAAHEQSRRPETETLKELLRMTKAIYEREFDRASREWPMLPFPEHADQRFSEAKQIFENVILLGIEADERQQKEVREMGT